MKRRIAIVIGMLVLSSLLVAGYLIGMHLKDPLAIFIDAYPEAAYDRSFEPYDPGNGGIGGNGLQRLSFKIDAPPEDILRFYQQAFEAKGWIACSTFSLKCSYVDYVSCAYNYDRNGFEHLAGYYHPSMIDPLLSDPNAVLLIKSVATTTETISLVELRQVPFSVMTSCPSP